MRISLVAARYIREALETAMTPIMDGAPVLTSQLSRPEQKSLQCIATDALQKRVKSTKKDSYYYGWLIEAINHVTHGDIYALLIAARSKWRKSEGLATNNTTYQAGRSCPWGRTEVSA